eukprot:653878-Lingulodinium_polyedra.AAC.1
MGYVAFLDPGGVSEREVATQGAARSECENAERSDARARFRVNAMFRVRDCNAARAGRVVRARCRTRRVGQSGKREAERGTANAR